MWIFGYGSLVWKADFPFEEKVVGYIKGYARRFWQASIDHRGVPGKPGRVVTLVKSENPEEEVWGVAYYISTEKENEVLNHLDHREKGGYLRRSVMFYPQSSNKEPWQLTIYVGTESNPFYTGPSDEEDIASIIVNSKGPSGRNVEYLFKLVNFMQEIGIKDDHLLAIHDKVTSQIIKKV